MFTSQNKSSVRDPDDLQQLSKTQLKNMVSKENFLPSEQSRALTREYLIKCRRQEVYLVNRKQLLCFEAEHGVDSTKDRVTSMTVLYLVSTLDILLAQLGRKSTGFTESNLPDEMYAYRIVRYTDPTNLIGAFRSPVQGLAGPNITATKM